MAERRSEQSAKTKSSRHEIENVGLVVEILPSESQNSPPIDVQLVVIAFVSLLLASRRVPLPPVELDDQVVGCIENVYPAFLGPLSEGLSLTHWKVTLSHHTTETALHLAFGEGFIVPTHLEQTAQASAPSNLSQSCGLDELNEVGKPNPAASECGVERHLTPGPVDGVADVDQSSRNGGAGNASNDGHVAGKQVALMNLEAWTGVEGSVQRDVDGVITTWEQIVEERRRRGGGDRAVAAPASRRHRPLLPTLGDRGDAVDPGKNANEASSATSPLDPRRCEAQIEELLQ